MKRDIYNTACDTTAENNRVRASMLSQIVLVASLTMMGASSAYAVCSTDVDMQTFNVTNLGKVTSSSPDSTAATKEYVDDQVDGNTYFKSGTGGKTYWSKTNSMDLNNRQIVNLATPTSENSAANKKYVDGKAGFIDLEISDVLQWGNNWGSTSSGSFHVFTFGRQVCLVGQVSYNGSTIPTGKTTLFTFNGSTMKPFVNTPIEVRNDHSNSERIQTDGNFVAIIGSGATDKVFRINGCYFH